MEFTECKKDVIHFILGNYKGYGENLTPMIDVFKQVFKEKYSSKEIEETFIVLVFSGISQPHDLFS